MDQRNVFFEEWIRSLREQYKHVLRQDDRVALPSLTAVMLDVGFGEDELAQLRIEATMHVDNVGTDYVADMEILEHTATPAAGASIDEDRLEADAPPQLSAAQQDRIEVGRVFSVPMIESNGENSDENTEAIDEDAPLTFEDSLAAQETETSGDEEDIIEAGDDDEDIEKPQQMNLF